MYLPNGSDANSVQERSTLRWERIFQDKSVRRVIGPEVYLETRDETDQTVFLTRLEGLSRKGQG